MNEQHPTFDANPADHHDRLMDRALAEIVGGSTPPDLTARIIDQVAAHQPEPATTLRKSLTTVGWSILTLAASISIVATVVYLFSDRTNVRSASASKLFDRSGKVKEALLAQLKEELAEVGGRTGAASEPFENRPLKRPQLATKQQSTSLSTLTTTEGSEVEFVASGGPWQSGELRDRGEVTAPKDQIAGDQPNVNGSGVQIVPLTSTRVPTGQIVEQPPSEQLLAGSPAQRDSASERLGQWGLALSDESWDTNDYAVEGESIRSPTRGDWLRPSLRRKKFASGDLREDALRDVNPPNLVDGLGVIPPAVRVQGPADTAAGTGPGSPGDQYTRIVENPFVKAVGGDAVSTFSIDVDTASYANVRQFLMDMRRLPPPDAVRIEELVNYFQYDYAGPNAADETPFASHVEVAGCPWAPEHRLVRIGIKGREIVRDMRPKSNLVFLVDVSGSMDEPNKLPLVIDGLRQLTRELGENDRVAIVVYASSEGLALESTRGDQQQAILAALDRLQAGGSTAGGAGIQLAYQIAEDHFIPGGTNRVVLCTDGDFNVGVTSTAELERLVVQKAKDTKVFLSVLGFGRGNLNDAMMQTIADRGNGNHHYVDSLREARKVLVEEMTGTLLTIAKDVKFQVEYNPAQVAAYRLIGYENRLLRTEDFNDDTKDAGEIGAGHTVTALYEVIPAGKPVDLPALDELKYQPAEQSNAKAIDDEPASDGDASAANSSQELLTLKMRYKEPEGDVSRKLEWPVSDAGNAFQDASTDFRFASAVAGFGLILRGSEYRGDATLDAVAEIAESSLGKDEQGYRTEFVELVRQAKSLTPADGSQKTE